MVVKSTASSGKGDHKPELQLQGQPLIEWPCQADCRSTFKAHAWSTYLQVNSKLPCVTCVQLFKMCAALPGVRYGMLSCLHRLFSIPNRGDQVHGGIIIGVSLDSISNAEQGGAQGGVLDVVHLHCLCTPLCLHL